MIYEGTDHLDLVWVVTTCTKKSIYINDPVVTQWLVAFQLHARQAIEHTHKCKVNQNVLCLTIISNFIESYY